MFTLIGLVAGKLLSALPFVGQLVDKHLDRKQEFQMAQLEAETRKSESVQRVIELQEQVKSLQASAGIIHEQALDKAEQTVLDALKPQPLPVAEPKTWWQALIDVPGIIVNFFITLLRPYIAYAVITLTLAIVGLEFWAIFFAAEHWSQVKEFVATEPVEVLLGSYGLIVGAIWGERGWRHNSGLQTR